MNYEQTAEILISRRNRTYTLNAFAREGDRVRVVVRVRLDNGDAPPPDTCVFVEGVGSTLYAGEEGVFVFQRGRWIDEAHVYGTLQSAIMKELYAVRSRKLTQGKPAAEEEAVLEKAWRCKTDERNYLGLKRSSHAVPVDLGDLEERLLGFRY